MTIDLSSISTAMLRQAIAIKGTIESLSRELISLVDGSGTAKPATRRKMSAATRAKIAASTKARWAGIAKTPSIKTAAPARKQRTMSPAAKAKLSALAKARWAKIKASGKNSM